MAVVEHPVRTLPRSKTVKVDERAARRTLRDQITKLERELASAFVGAFPRHGIDFGTTPAAGRARLRDRLPMERKPRRRLSGG